MTYLERNNLLSIYQFGFRSKRSTELAATLLVDNIRKEIDLGNYTGAIFLDLRKAFDTVSHGALLTYNKHYHRTASMVPSWPGLKTIYSIDGML